MTPTLITTAIIALALGFFIGRKTAGRPHGAFDDESAATFAAEGRAAVKARTEKRKARILEKARQQNKITNDDVEDLFCISDHTARNYLNELEREGKLEQHGATGRGVHYRPR